MFWKLFAPIFVTLLCAPTSVFAVERAASHKLTIFTAIHAVNPPAGDEENYTVLSTADGRVYKVDLSNAAALSLLELAASTHSNVEMHLNPSNPDFIESASLLDASRADAFTLLNWGNARQEDIVRENRENKLAPREYEASVLENKKQASELFASVFSYNKGYDVEDHCYDRAHYWGRMFYAEKKINSMKVFLFFTPKYQRENKYKWWFHVAPFVYVGDSEREYVLDPTFETEVMTMKAWSMDFADKAKSCVEGDTLDDYHDMGETKDCVLIKASMYHYLPDDLENNPSVSSWRCADLKRVTRGIPAPFKKHSWDEVQGFLPANCR